MQGNNT